LKEERRGMKMKNKILVTSAAIVLALFFSSSNAFSWGSATHAFIDDYLGKKRGLKNVNEIYGGMAPDVFNYMFDNPFYMGYLSNQTHNEFMKVWEKARWRREKALAYGFVSHNDKWGADYTAHSAEGYIIAKAEVLKGILEGVPEYRDLGLEDPVALEVSHNLVEAGIDLLIKRIDHMIGQKIISSALLRSPEFPFLLVKAYAKDFSQYAGISYLKAVNIIISTEREFRKTTILYGQALTQQDEIMAIQLISEQMAELSESFFAAYGITLPPGTVLTPLVSFAIVKSMEICAEDFRQEILETINFVNQQLNSNEISY